MKVTITFDNVPDGASLHEVRDAVNMAIGEYWSRRSPPDRYVAKRYTDHPQKYRDHVLGRVERAVALMQSAHVEVE